MAISINEQKILDRAGRIMERESQLADGAAMSSPDAVKRMLQYKIGLLEYEAFMVVMLDNRHRVLKDGVVEAFRGTIDSAAVYPREVVKMVLKANAAAVFFAHNHPSQICEPSDTDVRLTRKLTDALALIDVRVLDHFVLSGATTTSLAERGLM